uniref:Uncharacterized protein n=1 Tax=Anguilla anguilla TaxID=7936 RepID=A0A0E9P8S5_ANGAN
MNTKEAPCHPIGIPQNHVFFLLDNGLTRLPKCIKALGGTPPTLKRQTPGRFPLPHVGPVTGYS